MIGYNYNNIKITANNHTDLLYKQSNIINTLDVINDLLLKK